eukprot:sb/3477313/
MTCAARFAMAPRPPYQTIVTEALLQLYLLTHFCGTPNPDPHKSEDELTSSFPFRCIAVILAEHERRYSVWECIRGVNWTRGSERDSGALGRVRTGRSTRGQVLMPVVNH